MQEEEVFINSTTVNSYFITLKRNIKFIFQECVKYLYTLCWTLDAHDHAIERGKTKGRKKVRDQYFPRLSSIQIFQNWKSNPCMCSELTCGQLSLIFIAYYNNICSKPEMKVMRTIVKCEDFSTSCFKY